MVSVTKSTTTPFPGGAFPGASAREHIFQFSIPRPPKATKILGISTSVYTWGYGWVSSWRLCKGPGFTPIGDNKSIPVSTTGQTIVSGGSTDLWGITIGTHEFPLLGIYLKSEGAYNSVFFNVQITVYYEEATCFFIE